MNNQEMKSEIQQVIINMMERVLNLVTVEDKFSEEDHQKFKPLYAALVPDEIFRDAHFERKFVTLFGSVWERLAVVIATHSGKQAIRGYQVNGLVKKGRLAEINNVLNRLEHRRAGETREKPNWDKEFQQIMAIRGEDAPISVVCDLFIIDQDQRRYAFEVKTPLVNSDMTRVTKEKLLKLYAMEPFQVDEAYFALP